MNGIEESHNQYAENVSVIDESQHSIPDIKVLHSIKVPPPRISRVLLHTPKVIVGKERQKQIRKTYKQTKEKLGPELCRPLLKTHVYNELKKELEYYKQANSRLKSYCSKLEYEVEQHRNSATIIAQALKATEHGDMCSPRPPMAPLWPQSPQTLQSSASESEVFLTKSSSEGEVSGPSKAISEKEELHMLRVRCNDLMRETEQLRSILRSSGFVPRKNKNVGVITHSSIGIQADASVEHSNQKEEHDEHSDVEIRARSYLELGVSPNQQEGSDEENETPITALYTHMNGCSDEKCLIPQNSSHSFSRDRTPSKSFRFEQSISPNSSSDQFLLRRPSKPKGVSGAAPSPIMHSSSRRNIEKVWKRQPSIEDCITSYRLPKAPLDNARPVLRPKNKHWHLKMTGTFLPPSNRISNSRLRSKSSKSDSLRMYKTLPANSIEGQLIDESFFLTHNIQESTFRASDSGGAQFGIGDVVQVWTSGKGEWKVAKIIKSHDNNRYDVDFGHNKQYSVHARNIRQITNSEELEIFRITV